MAPPHAYIAPYLWIQKGFRADALIHFGTHGSLEFTPGKQVALSSGDWPDRLIGTVPHFIITRLLTWEKVSSLNVGRMHHWCRT